MAINNEYFDSIHIEIAKKKYYNAGKVNAVLADIRAGVCALCDENAALRAKLEDLSKGRDDISETLLSARSFSRSITADAEQRAAGIIADAEKRAAEIIAEAEKRAAEIDEYRRSTEDYAVSCVRESYDALRESLQAQLDAVNSGWQNFLANLSVENEASAVPEIPEALKFPKVPDDLSAKVALIADGLLDFDSIDD